MLSDAEISEQFDKVLAEQIAKGGGPIEAVTDMVRFAERAAYERAAQECETVKSKGGWEDYDDACQDCIDAIRALGRQHD